MIVLDLFSGKKGFSRPFAERGHEVYTVDIDASFEPTIVADVRELRWPILDIPRGIDAVVASPPCQKFSVAAIGRYWKKGVPQPEVVDAIGLVATTLRLIAEIAPRFWVMENPTGMLRTIIGPPRGPHEPAPKGSKAGVDNPSLTASERAELPYGLGEELCRRFEDVLAGRPGSTSDDRERSSAVDRELPIPPGGDVRQSVPDTTRSLHGRRSAMRRLETKVPEDLEKEKWLWHVDAQGRAMHRDGGYFLQHAAKTLYVREMGRWQKLGYWCDRCHVGLLLEPLEGRSTRSS